MLFFRVTQCNSQHEGTNVEKNKKTKLEMVALHTGRLMFSFFLISAKKQEKKIKIAIEIGRKVNNLDGSG